MSDPAQNGHRDDWELVDRALASADPAEALAALEGLHRLRRTLAEYEPRLLAAARRGGASWAEIAPAVGVASRQAAERRYLRLTRVDGEPVRITGEQRVRAARDRRAGDREVARWAAENAGPLRQLAGQISGLEDLDAPTRRQAARVRSALGQADPVAMLEPLARIQTRLRTTAPGLAVQLAGLLAAVEDLRAPRT